MPGWVCQGCLKAFAQELGTRAESSLQNLKFNPRCQLVTLETRAEESSPFPGTCRDHYWLQTNPK